jgi:hypothetical protein
MAGAGGLNHWVARLKRIQAKGNTIRIVARLAAQEGLGGSQYTLFDIGKTRAILFGPSLYLGLSPEGGAGNGLD